jgi:hypothetical protein
MKIGKPRKAKIRERKLEKAKEKMIKRCNEEEIRVEGIQTRDNGCWIQNDYTGLRMRGLRSSLDDSKLTGSNCCCVGVNLNNEFICYCEEN